MTFREETLSVQIPNPIYSFSALIDSLKKKIINLFEVAYSNFQNGISQVPSSAKRFSFKLPNIKLPKFNNFRFNKNFLIKGVLSIVGVIIVVVVLSQVFTPKPSIQGVSDESVEKPIAAAAINRDFSFPLRDEDGEEAGRFKYVVESAEKRKQIIVKGQKATSVEGRVFLILNLKLINELDQGININTRDYVRIYVNGKENELFAPDIHNDPVEAQAISTKNTRLGLAINENDRDIVLKIGEIDGDKEEIKLDF